MEFKEVQNAVIKNAVRYGKKHGITFDEDFVLIKLYEEIGELSQAMLIHQKRSRAVKHVPKEVSKRELAKELADVVNMAMVLAHVLDIDLEEAIDKKCISKEWVKKK